MNMKNLRVGMLLVLVLAAAASNAQTKPRKKQAVRLPTPAMVSLLVMAIRLLITISSKAVMVTRAATVITTSSSNPISPGKYSDRSGAFFR